MLARAAAQKPAPLKALATTALRVAATLARALQPPGRLQRATGPLLIGATGTLICSTGPPRP
eukprot:2551695-Lingulodinium_polyedra.AAC.1